MEITTIKYERCTAVNFCSNLVHCIDYDDYAVFPERKICANYTEFRNIANEKSGKAGTNCADIVDNVGKVTGTTSTAWTVEMKSESQWKFGS